ncbi:MAG: hypothetical protein IPK10_16160 [Bacteroidetes bacterium]|nr:hypothetical protein [Bacteroidota bacterium]
MFKNLKTTILALIFCITTSVAQVPNMINYQGVAHDTSGTPIANQLIKVRLKIHDATSFGPVVYSEVRKLTTDASGLFNIKIGSTGANSTTGSWAAINWASGLKYLQVEMDPAGGNSYINMGSQQFLSVPFAQHAQSAESLSGSANINPSQINNGGAAIGQVLQFDGANWSPANISVGGSLSLPYITSDPNLTSFGITNTSAIGGSAIYGKTNTNSSTATGIKGESTGASGNGVYGKSSGANSFGVLGENPLGIGVKGTSNTASYSGVQGINTITGGKGVVGIANTGTNSIGVEGNANAGIGVSGYSNTNRGVSGATISGTALYGLSSTGYALEAVGKVKISGGNTTPGAGKVLTSDASGNATWQSLQTTPKIAFRASGGTSKLFPHNIYTKQDFPTEEYDLSNNFTAYAGSSTTTSSVFTAPFNGIYHFSAGAHLSMNSATNSFSSTDIFLIVETNGVAQIVAKREGIIRNTISFCDGDMQIDTDILLVSGQRVYVQLKHFNGSGTSHTTTTYAPENYFSGYLVSPF